MDKRPTIVDVAKKAGVSKSTVSLVVRNSSSVRDETRLAVLHAMEELGYVYNRSAANMRTGNAGLVGLVINDLTNPFFTEFATSLQMALNEKGYATVVANTDDNPEIQDRVVGAMLEHGVSALILSPAYGDIDGTLATIKRSGVPTVHVLRKLPPKQSIFPFVAPDYVSGGRMAMEHFVSRGFKHIAFVGGLENFGVTNERMAGYLEGMAGIGADPIVLSGRPTREFGSNAAKILREQYPKCQGAVCFNDLVALGLLNACNKIGHEIDIIGFDDIQEGQYSWPALNTISCDIAVLANEIANNVLAWLENGKMPEEVYRSGVSLTVRS